MSAVGTWIMRLLHYDRFSDDDRLVRGMSFVSFVNMCFQNFSDSGLMVVFHSMLLPKVDTSSVDTGH